MPGWTLRCAIAILPLALLSAAVAATGDRPGLAEICADFQAWYEKHSPTADESSAYRAALIARSLPTEEVERRMELIRRSAHDCPAAAGAAFDRIYRDPVQRFSTAPNALLAETVEDLAPGRALDVAMGQGRNAVFLAQRGWEVTGFDVSAEGLSIARAAAEAAEVRIRAVHQGWQEFDLGRERWDLIVLSYAWVPIDDAAFVRRLVDSLRPGGHVVFEHLLGESRAGLGVPASQQLLRTFDGLRILRYEEVEQTSDWNNEVAPVVRLVARK